MSGTQRESRDGVAVAEHAACRVDGVPFVPAHLALATKVRLVLFILLTATGVCRAIPPWRPSLENILSRPVRVVVARLTDCTRGTGRHALEEIYRFDVLRVVAAGEPLHGVQTGTYGESCPYRGPDGKVEAPIYTGSGIEHSLHTGDAYVFILEAAYPQVVLRVEPVERLPEITRLLEHRQGARPESDSVRTVGETAPRPR